MNKGNLLYLLLLVPIAIVVALVLGTNGAYEEPATITTTQLATKTTTVTETNTTTVIETTTTTVAGSTTTEPTTEPTQCLDHPGDLLFRRSRY